MAPRRMERAPGRLPIRRSSLGWTGSEAGKLFRRRFVARQYGRIDNLPVLEKLAELSQKKSFEHLALSDCSLKFGWKYPKIDIENIAVESRGEFRIDVEISIEQRRLRGTIRLGLTREYLDWLPNPKEVFSRKQDGYLWTNVHLSGTIDDPGQDLSPRIIDLFKQSPGAYLRLLFANFEDCQRSHGTAINTRV